MKDSLRLYPDPFLPEKLQPQDEGIRPNVARLLNMLDQQDPSFPAVASVLSDMLAAGVELSEETILIAQKMGKLKPLVKRDKRRFADIGLPMWADDGNSTSIVYYIRRGTHIKIGTTTRPHQRFAELAPEEILAYEPGDRRIERHRHHQFGHLRRGASEYFIQGHDLNAHVKRMRRLHGDPDSSWRTLVNAEERGHRLPRELPAPVSVEVVTATEGARAVGVAVSTVTRWAYRGQLRRAGRAPSGRHVYYLDHIKLLADKSAARRMKLAAEAPTSSGQETPRNPGWTSGPKLVTLAPPTLACPQSGEDPAGGICVSGGVDVAEYDPDEVYLTTAQAAELCGVTTACIRQWVKREYLAPVGRDGRGRMVFTQLAVAKAEFKTRKAARRQDFVTV